VSINPAPTSTIITASATIKPTATEVIYPAAVVAGVVSRPPNVSASIPSVPGEAQTGAFNTGVQSSSGSTPAASGPSSSSASGQNDSAATTQSATRSVTLSWAAPNENTDGTALTNLAGYVIYYGTIASAMTNKINITTVGVQTYVITDLSSGQWYFTINAVNAAGVESGSAGTKTVSI
jgi:hypothetical protein